MQLMEADGIELAPVNLGNPEEFTILQLLERVVAQTRSTSRVSYKSLPIDDPRRRRPDIGRARDLLGWTPRVSLEEGLRITCDFFATELRSGGDDIRRLGGDNRQIAAE